jgi:hypothetical protein
MKDPIYDFPQGFWRAGDQKFINKYDALLYATQNKFGLKYVYFNHVWEQFDRSLLGKFSLKELYRQRAQQLRDSYDYLILYFSGGSDSYNVLRSFIDNGIKLDEVCVKWTTPAIEGKHNIYTPNIDDKSAFNCISEWDFTIKPKLDWLSKNHPEIKIEIIDWVKRKDVKLEDAFSLVNHWHDSEIPSLAMWSASENKMLEKGKTVASIYGVDKPSIYFEDQNYYIKFIDAAFCIGTPNPNNIYGTEYFYWTPKFPILAFEMANQIIESYKINPELVQNRITVDNIRKIDHVAVHQFNESNYRSILYDTWDNSFQSNKPVRLDRSDKNFWIFQNQELKNYKEEYQSMFNERLDQIRSTGPFSLVWNSKNNTRLYNPCHSSHFFVKRET